MTETIIERMAKAIASGLGYEWETLYEDKADYNADHGLRHDVNTPFRPEFRDAAEEALKSIREPTEAQLRAAWEKAHCNIDEFWRAYIDAAFAEQGRAEVETYTRELKEAVYRNVF